MLLLIPGPNSDSLVKDVARETASELEIDCLPSLDSAKGFGPGVWCVALVEKALTPETVERATLTRATIRDFAFLVVTAQRSFADTRASVPIDHIAWVNDGPTGLAIKVRRSRIAQVRQRLRSAALTEPELATPVRQFLVAAAEHQPPPYAVQRITGDLGYARSSLWRSWVRVHSRTGPRLEDVADWLLLLEATGLKTRRIPWSCVAEQLQVHEHTIGRIAYRLMRISLGKLSTNVNLILSSPSVDHMINRFVGR